MSKRIDIEYLLFIYSYSEHSKWWRGITVIWPWLWEKYLSLTQMKTTGTHILISKKIFKANKILDESQRKAVLLSSCRITKLCKTCGPWCNGYHHCTTSLNDILRDRLVCGINHERTQQYLLSDGSNLTLEKALDIALSLKLPISQTGII